MSINQQRSFHDRLRKYGWNYADVVVLCQIHNMPRPSVMSDSLRNKLIKRLAAMSMEDREMFAVEINLHNLERRYENV